MVGPRRFSFGRVAAMNPCATGRVRRWALPALLLAALGLQLGRAAADTQIEGTVGDALGGTVANARVTVKDRGQLLSEGFSDARGRFLLPIRFGSAGQLVLIVEHQAYVTETRTVTISGSEPTERDYEVVLMPEALASCPKIKGAIVVGKFLPPPTQPTGDLTAYVHNVLKYRILTTLQAQQLRDQLDREFHHLVPQFLRCADAFPAHDAQGPAMAAAVDGQGIVWGTVAASDGLFDVSATIADVNEVFRPPLSVTSPNVDLAHFSEAVVAPMAKAAVLVSVLGSLVEHDQCPAAIYVSEEVEKLISESALGNTRDPRWDLLESKNGELRGTCQRRLPHVGLVEGGSP